MLVTAAKGPAEARADAPACLCTAHAPVAQAATALRALQAQGGTRGFSLVLLFVSARGNFPAIAAEASAIFPDAQVAGCTTAGEIASTGYEDGQIVALGFRAEDFLCRIAVIEDLHNLGATAITDDLTRLRSDLARARPDWPFEFAALLTDGLSRREDQLMSALRFGLGTMPLFGGSAGDGLAFRRTAVFANGRVRDNAAVLALIRTRCPVRVFMFDHFHPTDVKMVVTSADPEQRLVRELNAEPAAVEYARLVGLDPSQLSPFVFAAHPVVVSVGGRHHVRAIQQVQPNGDLTFFSAIDEGLVLSVARPTDIVAHLDRSLAELSAQERPQAIVAFDCILRRLEVEQSQNTRAVSRLLSAHNVSGFNTYGEQYNSVHVNQTFTGVAIYAPGPEP